MYGDGLIKCVDVLPSISMPKRCAKYRTLSPTFPLTLVLLPSLSTYVMLTLESKINYTLLIEMVHHL